MPLASTRTLSGALTLALLAPATFAGGAAITSVQPGNWSDGSTWSSGSPPQSFEFVYLDHEVELSLGDQSVLSTIVGSSQPASLKITGGSLDSPQLTVGSGESGSLTVEGGQLTTNSVFVGSTFSTAGGEASVSGGVVQAQSLVIGAAGPGTLNLIGSDQAVFVSAVLRIGSNGRLTIEPDALDLDGLFAIHTKDVEFEPGSKLTLDTNALQPRIGDVWNVIGYSGSLVGAPSVVETTGEGYAAEAIVTIPGVVRVVVTQVPPFVDLGGGSPGGVSPVVLDAESSLTPGIPLTITLSDAPPPLALLWISVDSQPFVALGGTVYATPYGLEVPLATGAGDVVIPTVWPVGIPAGTQFWMQAIAKDTTIPGLVLSNALRGTAH
ncbi:MAG: hypothetical protein H6825_00510 [Planctomycetes bacterium]|nr:hypothetical protein [Planctomycetota bacterium]